MTNTMTANSQIPATLFPPAIENQFKIEQGFVNGETGLLVR
jgi:hypothetical protein